MKTFQRKWIVLTAMILGLIVAVVLLLPPANEPPSPPSPNAYADLAQAAHQVHRAVAADEMVQVDGRRALRLDALKRQVSTNAEVLVSARSIMTQPIAAPTEFTLAYIQQHTQDLGNLKALAQAFRQEGDLAKHEGRWDEAATSYRDAVRLGSAISQNGLLIDRLVGIACEAIGLQGIEDIVEHLSEDQRAKLAAELKLLRAAAPSAESCLQRESFLSDDMIPFHIRPIRRLLALLPNSAERRSRTLFAQKCATIDQQYRAVGALLVTDSP